MAERLLHVEQLTGETTASAEVEIIERKGKGHPDSLIDGACEAVSRSLCEYYQKEYNTILHHNVDKGLLVGGRSNPQFGGGDVVEPIYVIVAGRAICFASQGGDVQPIPVGAIAISAIKKHLKSTLRYLDTENHVIVDYKIKQGSTDLVSVFDRKGSAPLANDTSVGVAFAPFTPTEQLVLESEQLLNSEKVKQQLPEVGEDIKVMGLRRGKEVSLTIGAAMISTLVRDASHYVSVVDEAKNLVADLASKVTGLSVDVQLNSGDEHKRGDYYITVTGTSAESGDDGNTGRGNRPCGLINPMRQYSMEATAGKNPVNHTGKIFNVLAQDAADKIVKKVKGVEGVYVRILSRIGSPLDQPRIASAAVHLESGTSLSSVNGEIMGIINEEFDHIQDITPRILSGSVKLF